MASLGSIETASPLPLLVRRETGLASDVRSKLFSCRLAAARNLYRRDLLCHYGCVNAIEFSENGEYLVSGGDDRRVMLWKFNETILQRGKPEQMRGQHQSNIFCLGITSDNQRIYSGGNDDQVVVHDVESGRAVELLAHQRAVCGLGIHPHNQLALATAGNDGRLLYFDTRHSDHESMVIARSRKAFHAVMFHPTQLDMLVSANARDGIALWDLRSNKQPVVRYMGNSGCTQNSMSVRFNGSGTRVLALRRRLPPVLYDTDRSQPVAEFCHQDYYNSCTMKSCSFAGDCDQYVLSGSDDFNLYMWKIPDGGGSEEHETYAPQMQVAAHVVLYGHRSIVNQVRYNKSLCVVASSGVEKVIKIWSTLEYPGMSGSLLDEGAGLDNPREVYSHEDYVSLVHHGGQYISHNYSEQSTSEDPRMMAFFDSLVLREVEGLAEETDSQSDSDSDATYRHVSKDSDSSDSDHILIDFLPLHNKRASMNGRNQRCTRISRRLASRNSKHLSLQMRGSASRRNKQTRGLLSKSSACGGGSSVKGKRVVSRSAWNSRRSGVPVSAPRHSAPSSERTDSDEPSHSLYRHTGKIIRPLRRRMNLSRTLKRKTSSAGYQKLEIKTNGDEDIAHSINSTAYENGDDYLALPSTSTGYRGQNSSLFRIAEVDSDDDQSASSRPISPGHQNGTSTPLNLVSIIPTPINGSRDSLGESLRSTVPGSTSNPSSPSPGARPWAPRRSTRRAARSGVALHRSDSSESPSPKERDNMHSERLSYSPIVRKLLDETNESEMESSCSTGSAAQESVSPARRHPTTPDSGVCTGAGGSSSRPHPPADDASDDPEWALLKFRQRVKRARRNYRNNIGDSDSN